jgi:hypothetical protein
LPRIGYNVIVESTAELEHHKSDIEKHSARGNTRNQVFRITSSPKYALLCNFCRSIFVAPKCKTLQDHSRSGNLESLSGSRSFTRQNKHMNNNTKKSTFGVSNLAREGLDFYPTPPEATMALLDFLDLPRQWTIWEPACGTGGISKVAEDYGYSVISTDIADYGYGTPNVDFTEEVEPRANFILTNPPFNQAEKFIEAASSMEIEGFAFLLKAQYWNAKTREPLFRRCQPTWVLPLTWRPDFTDGKGNGSPIDFLWTVWLHGVTDTRYRTLTKPCSELIPSALIRRGISSASMASSIGSQKASKAVSRPLA